MPKGSKKRRADKRKKELEAKTNANDAAEPPPAPNSQENSTGVATASAANLAELADNMVEGVVQNKNVLARNVVGSKENEASKEFTLVNEIACNIPCLSNSENEASKENEGEKVLVDDDIIVQNSSEGETVVTDTVIAEGMTQIEDQFKAAVIAEEIEEEKTQALMAAGISNQFEVAVIAEERAEETTQALMAADISNQFEGAVIVKEIAEETTQAITAADNADQFEEAVVAEETTQAFMAAVMSDQFEEAVMSDEMTQVLLNKKVDQSANLVARDILKKTISFLSAEQNLKQNEGNLLASFEVENKNSNEDMVAMGTDEQVPILDVSRDETNAEMVETLKESPGIDLQLNRIKEMVETGLSIADNMKELFLIIMDDLNAILDA